MNELPQTLSPTTTTAVKEFRIKSATNIGIQGRIRVHMRTRGHDLGEHLDITEVWGI